MTPEELAKIEARLVPAARKLSDGDSLCCGWDEAYAKDVPALVAEIKRLRGLIANAARLLSVCGLDAPEDITEADEIAAEAAKEGGA